MKKGQKGFTLIELLIVIAIVGILVAVVVPNVANLTAKGEKAAGQAEMQAVQTAIDATMADTGHLVLSSPVTIDKDHGDIDTGLSILPMFRGTLKGSWNVATTGEITGGTYGSWTYTDSTWSR